jgi:hypothetical protein
MLLASLDENNELVYNHELVKQWATYYSDGSRNQKATEAMILVSMWEIGYEDAMKEMRNISMLLMNTGGTA